MISQKKLDKFFDPKQKFFQRIDDAKFNKIKLNDDESKKIAEGIYQHVLDNIIHPLIGRDETWGSDLKRIAKILFGIKFAGVFSADKLPQLNKSVPYAIINLDLSNEPGSHWIALAYDPKKKAVWIYDSFGRPTEKILPLAKKKYKKILMTEDDAEQDIREENCGARCLSFLYTYDKFGSQLAKWI